MAEKRKAQQFFTYKETNMVLCDDGTVWSWEVQFVKSDDGSTMTEKNVWTRRSELETPGD